MDICFSFNTDHRTPDWGSIEVPISFDRTWLNSVQIFRSPVETNRVSKDLDSSSYHVHTVVLPGLSLILFPYFLRYGVILAFPEFFNDKRTLPKPIR